MQSAFLAFGRAVLYLLFVVRFFARRAKKRTTDEMGSTLLPQAKRRLCAAPRNSSLAVTAVDTGACDTDCL
jgi:hypothetical protein